MVEVGLGHEHAGEPDHADHADEQPAGHVDDEPVADDRSAGRAERLDGECRRERRDRERRELRDRRDSAAARAGSARPRAPAPR